MSSSRKKRASGSIRVPAELFYEETPTTSKDLQPWKSSGTEALDITVGFSTTNKWISRIIRAVTGGTVSHAWISFYDETLQMRLVMQAEAWGFEVRPWHRWLTENKLIAEFRPVKNLTKSLQWIAGSLGVKYDWKSALFAGLWRWFGIWFRGRFSSPSKMMCSEAVIRFLCHGGVIAVSHLDPEVTPPARLLAELKKSREFTRA